MLSIGSSDVIPKCYLNARLGMCLCANLSLKKSKTEKKNKLLQS